jgi:hypothetical protein
VTAEGGGAFLADNPGSSSPGYSLVNSTVSGNTAMSDADDGRGGGLNVDAGLHNSLVTINHSTINANTAEAGGGGNAGEGGNLRTRSPGPFSANIDLRASIVANGVGLAGGENCFASGAQADFDSSNFNVESTNPSQCALDQSDDIVGSNPMLSALALNGGTTMNHALGAGSAAINRVTSGCPPPATDQRGVTRPQDGLCDSGSFERIPPPAPPVVTGVSPASGSNDNQPKVTGTAASGTTIDIYATSNCTGSPVATGSQTDFASPGITVTVADNSNTTFRATATDVNGTSDCSTTSVAYQEVTPPAPPVLTGVTPVSGSNDNQPKVIGTAPVGTTVNIYATPTCTGTPVATGSQTAFASPGIPVAVADNSTTTFRATTTDVNGTSTCSTTSISYQEITPPPLTPVTPVTPVAPKKKCKKGRKLKKGKCVKKKRKKKR